MLASFLILLMYVRVLAALELTKLNHTEGVVRIGFGSCHSTRLTTPLWSHIVERKPHVWIFGGDNIYADRMLKDPLQALLRMKLPFEEANETDIFQAYQRLHELPGYRALLDSGVQTIAIWDDHDYGITPLATNMYELDDGDRTYELRDVSKRLFLSEMVRANKNDPRWGQQGGIYVANTFQVKGDPTHLFRVIALDVRYSKDPWSTPASQGDMLGKEQWLWLEKELCENRSPRVNLIVSGLQILPEFRGGGESWSLFPNSRNRLFRLLRKCETKAPLLLSGDVHMAEIFEGKCGQSEKNLLVEVTSSGLTHSWGTRPPGWGGELPFVSLYLEKLMTLLQKTMPWNYRSIRAIGAPREGAYYLGLNFAEIDLDFINERVKVDVVGVNNVPELSQTWSFQDLDSKRTNGNEQEYTCEPLRGHGSYIHLILARALLVSLFFIAPVSILLAFLFVIGRWLCFCRGR